jgi:hypothetical protein
MKRNVLVLGFAVLATVNAGSKYVASFVLQVMHLSFNLKHEDIKV